MNNIEQALEENARYKREYLDQYINKTVYEGMTERLTTWKKKNPIKSKTINWFMSKKYT